MENINEINKIEKIKEYNCLKFFNNFLKSIDIILLY